MFRFFFLILSVFIFFSEAKAQETSNSQNFYLKIQERANKSKIGRWIYSGIFNSNSVDTNINREMLVPVETENPFIDYQGKIIRNISVIVLDPFGYSVNRLYSKKPDRLDAIGNRLHVTTRDRKVRNFLLFNTNQALDPLELSESERLLRANPFIFDARLQIENTLTGNGDSVDVLVLVQDRWSISAGSQFDLNNPNVSLIEKNILGFGQQLEQGFSLDIPNSNLNTSGKYSAFNMWKSFVNASVYYSTFAENQQQGIILERPFYSPLAKWAGGLKMETTKTVYRLEDSTGIQISTYPLQYNYVDYWAAKSFPINQKNIKNLEEKSSNFILAARYNRINYLNRPSFSIDTLEQNKDASLYLSSFGFSRRSYYKEKFLYRFGANEDVPEGFSVEFLMGGQEREFDKFNYYYGSILKYGNHIKKFGYLSANLSYGTFVDFNTLNSGVAHFNLLYFTDLLKWGDWYFRQFIKFRMVQGFNRPFNNTINLNGSDLYGFKSPIVFGNAKSIFNVEFIMYAPYKLLGFQFAPIIFCGFGSVGNNLPSVFQNVWYPSYALGVLIRNEYLIANTFQFSLGFYPYIPGNEGQIFKNNPIANYGVGAQDYLIARPELVNYE